MLNFDINANYPVKDINYLIDEIKLNTSILEGEDKYIEACNNIINFFNLDIEKYICVWNSGATETISQLRNSDIFKNCYLNNCNHAIAILVNKDNTIIFNNIEDRKKLPENIVSLICPISPATGKIYNENIDKYTIIDATQSIRYWHTPLLSKLKSSVSLINPICIFSSCYKFGAVRNLGFAIYRKDVIESINPIILSKNNITPYRGGSLPLYFILHASRVINEYKNINNFSELHERSKQYYNYIYKIFSNIKDLEINNIESCELDNTNKKIIDIDKNNYTYSTISFSFMPKYVCAKKIIKDLYKEGIEIGYITACDNGDNNINRISWDYQNIKKEDIIYLVKKLLEEFNKLKIESK